MLGLMDVFEKKEESPFMKNIMKDMFRNKN